ncbi:MAG: hypothetical protein K2N90_11965 [Lachnospiraceae bacterium]|nr:hypothetical protein [Lachnospiraceae bacterium]
MNITEVSGIRHIKKGFTPCAWTAIIFADKGRCGKRMTNEAGLGLISHGLRQGEHQIADTLMKYTIYATGATV